MCHGSAVLHLQGRRNRGVFLSALLLGVGRSAPAPPALLGRYPPHRWGSTCSCVRRCPRLDLYWASRHCQLRVSPCRPSVSSFRRSLSGRCERSVDKACMPCVADGSVSCRFDVSCWSKRPQLQRLRHPPSGRKRVCGPGEAAWLPPKPGGVNALAGTPTC